MKNLYEASTVQEIHQRLAQLQPDSPRQWGKMDAAQAMAHCALAMEWAVGDRATKQLLIGRIFAPLIKPKLLGTDEPMRRNTGTAKELIIADTRDLERERARLASLIDRFCTAGPSACTKNPHPFFGRITPEQWAIVMYKHVDHHCRQFGV